MAVHLTATLWLALAGALVNPATSGDWQHPDIATWVASAESLDASPEERTAALDGLRDAARGQPREELTREAIIALAIILRDEDQTRPHEALELMKTAAAYYPGDPRSAAVLRRLAVSQVAAGEKLAAHFTLANLLQRPDAPSDPGLLAHAAANALDVGETASALAWSRRVDPAAIPDGSRVEFWLVRLEAAGRLRRYPEAGEAVARLEQLDAASIRQDPDALLAAARTEEALGRSESAADRYQAFVNVYTRHAERPAALLEQGLLLTRLQRAAAALRSFDWILSEHADSSEVDPALLERVRIDPDLSPAGRAGAYRDVTQRLRAEVYVSEACSRILETLLAAGQPLEALSTLSWMIRHAPGPASVQARKHLIIGLQPAMAMLADRGDDTGLAAVAAQTDSLGIELPPLLATLAQQAQRRLGLLTPAERRIESARESAREERWDDVAEALGVDGSVLETAFPGAMAHTRARLMAEAEWRLGATAAALERIDAALGSELEPSQARPLLVLRGDIRFLSGDRVAACADYGTALHIADSTWVTHQMAGCDPVQGPQEEPSP